MKLLKSSLLASLLLVPNFVFAEADKVVTFDLNASSIKWVGKKITENHDGLIKVSSATGTLKADGTVQGEFGIDVNSITVRDIEDPKYNKKLENHLKSDDFFSASKHPLIKFTITSSEKLADGSVKIKGDLNVKGIVHPVEFPAKVVVEGNKVTASGKATVDRTKFDVKYNSGKFFGDLGDKLIYDDFDVEINLVGQV